jgi:hypothetical protein
MSYDQALGLAFWYDFDKRTKYSESFLAVLQASGAFAVQSIYHDARSKGQYPAAFRAFVQPRQNSWRQIASLQTTIFQQYFNNDLEAVRLAFEDFGQGVLIDTHPERVENGDGVHMMDIGGDAPPVGYHRWHASIRAIQLLLPQEAFWSSLDQFVAFGWAVQSLARPKQQNSPNPNLPAATLSALKLKWLALSPVEIDEQYDLGSGVDGYHPNPLGV